MELEGHQEVVLLKDALIMAKERNLHFDDKKLAFECSLTVKEAASDVDMIMSIDGMTPSDREIAQRNMHLLLFAKTILSSEDLDEAHYEHYSHICSSLPNIGWATYATIIQACDWLEFAAEIWKNQPCPMHCSILQNILKCMDDANLVTIWEVAIRQMIDWISLNDIGPNLDITDIVNCTHYMVQNAVKIASDDKNEAKYGILTKLLGIFGYCFTQKQEECNKDQESNLYALCRGMMLCIEKMLTAIPYPQVKIQLNTYVNHHDVILKISEMLASIEMGSFPELQNLIEHENMRTCSQEDIVNADVAILSSRIGQYSVALERLLNEFEASTDPAILECFLHNVTLLQPCHLDRLLQKVGKCQGRKDEIQLQQAICEAFSNWSLETQDIFREKFHKFHGFRDDVFIDTNATVQQIVQIINKLSTVDENECLVAKEISLLCLKTPMKMLTKLFNHVVHSGQIQTVTKVLNYLKRSCCFHSTFEYPDISYATTVIIQLLSDTSLRMLEFENLMHFTKAMIQDDLLQCSELLVSCILPMLDSPPTACRALKLLQVTLKCIGDKETDLFCTHRPALLLLKTNKLLHYCMTMQLDPDHNFVHLKEEILATQELIIDLITKTPGCIEGHEICWLWEQHKELDDTTLCYLKELLDSYGLIHLYMKKVKKLPLTILLVFCCTAHSSKDFAMNLLLEKCQKVSWSKACFPLKMAISKILPRLTADEIYRLTEQICILIRECSDPCTGIQSAAVSSVAMLMDSLVILSNYNQFTIPKVYLEQVSQICVSSVKNFLVSLRPTPITALAQLICILCCTSTNLQGNMQRVVEVLILDLCTQVHPYLVDENYRQLIQVINKAVENTNSDRFVTQAKKLLENVVIFKNK